MVLTSLYNQDAKNKLQKIKQKGQNRMIEKMSREDIEIEILENDDLYEIFDEERLLSRTYTDDELKRIAHEWILDNDECEQI